VTTTIDLVVCLIVAAITENEIAFFVPLETRSGNHVEDSVGSVAVFGVITAPLDFDVVDIFGINLGADVAGDVRVWDRHAVDKPTVLVSATDVEHVVDHVRSWDIVRDHG
jgi:hypothetical protein